MLQSVVIGSLVAASGWVIPDIGGRVVCGAPSVWRCSWPLMQEGGDAAVVSDFTEDLLDALSADEAPLSLAGEAATFVQGAEGVELDPMPSFNNAKEVAAMRAKYATHPNDTGSATVQVAVLSARIQYMTKHMQKNKKDYASLRGLTAMVTRRRKLLEYLLREDPTEFYRLTSELGIRTNMLLKPKLAGARGRRI